jgi:uncharacterized membrane protein YedE/YeeE
MTDARTVRSFFLLPYHRAFDPSLLFVAVGALPIGIFLYHFARGNERALLGRTTLVATGKIDSRLLIGSAIFGIGWGMTGICRKRAKSILSQDHHRVNCGLISWHWSC